MSVSWSGAALQVRRRSEDRVAWWLRATSPRGDGDGVQPVRGGQLLLLGVGVTVAVAAPLLRPGPAGWTALGVISAVMVAVLAASVFVPWRRAPAWATLCFPFLVCAGLVALHLSSAALAAPLTGVLVLCAAYVGLTHRSGTVFVLLPVSAATFVVVNGPSTVTSVRLVIAAIVWILLAQLLAHLTSRQRALSRALLSAAQTDVLTGVGNRREIDLRLAATRAGDVVVLCDLDHFKRLNDSQGHLAGDRVLADFGALLRAGLREGDFAGRFGGEEFMLLLPDTSVETAMAVVRRLRKQWRLMSGGVTFSAGIADCTDSDEVQHSVLLADRALYAAKTDGRDRVRVAHLGFRQHL